MRHTVRITIDFDMEVSDVEAAEEVVRASLGDLGEHAEIDITLDKMYEAEKMLKDGASYQEVHRTFGIARKTLSSHFPGYGWSQAQGAQWREVKAVMEEANIAMSPEKQRKALERIKAAPKTCSKGLHEMTEENTVTWRNGRRRCKPCSRQYQQDYRKGKAKA